MNETNRRYRGALAANAGLIIGVGIGRYSYTALVPMVVISGYLTPEQGGYTAAANLAGYVAGAIVAERAARQWQALIVLRAALLGTLCGLALSAMPWGFAWLTACRFSVGFTAGVIMAVGCSVVIQETTRAHLPSTTGIIFSGVGIGIVLSATIVSVLGGVSVALAWIALVAAGLLALPVAWSGWPIPRNVTNPDAGTDRKESTDPITTTPPRLRTQVLLHLAAYFLYGIALMPHTLFWVDFIVRDLGKGAAAGGANWALAGCGALVGAIASASLGGRIGFFWALHASFLLSAAALLLPILSQQPLALSLSSLLFGVMIPGLPAVISGRVRELSRGSDYAAVWGKMTAAVAIGQGVGGFAMAWLFDATQLMQTVFATGAMLLIIASLLCLPGWRIR